MAIMPLVRMKSKLSMTDKTDVITIEERLQPWIDQAEYVIALTIIIMAWSAGWVDLLAFESFTTTVFGRYSLPFFGLFVVYSLGFVFWFYLVLTLRGLNAFRKFIDTVQNTPLLAVAIFGIFAALIASMIFIRYWVFFQLLQGMVLTLILVFTVLILFTKYSPESNFQLWRKIIIAGLGLFFGVELIFHALAFFGALPLQNTSGLYTPYGLVYQNEEGQSYTRTNRFGWYYPDFEVDEDNYNIVLNGDTYVQGLQVPVNENMGVQLQNLISDDETQVMSLGQSGYGPGVYLSSALDNFIWSQVAPDEFVIFFHLANDFQVVDAPNSERVYYITNEDERAVLHPDDSLHRHVLEHVVFAGHQPPLLIETILSQSFLINELRGWLRRLNPPPPPYELSAPENSYVREAVPFYSVIPHIDNRNDAMPFGSASFVFQVDGSEQAETAYEIALGQLDNFFRYMRARDISIRLVTIPFFPESFYETQSGTDWDATFDGYDILLPEQRFADFTTENDIPFIAGGTLMQSQGFSVEEIQALFFNEGTGHLTAAGYQFFAEAMHNCFYAEDAPLTCP